MLKVSWVIHVVILTVKNEISWWILEVKNLWAMIQSFEVSPLGTIYDQDSRDHNNHFATWPMSNLSPWKNDQKACLANVPESCGVPYVVSPCPFGQERCISGSSTCRIAKCSFSCWRCGAHAGACFTWALGLSLPVTHHLQNLPVQGQCCWWWWIAGLPYNMHAIHQGITLL